MAEADLIEYSLLAQESGAFGATLTFGQITGPCSMATVGFGARLVDGGFSPHSETTLTLRKSVWQGPFKTGQPLSVQDACGKSRNLKIASQGIRDAIYFWELTCDDQNENA